MTVKNGKNKKSFLKESGYALVFAIFLVVGLETVIAGSMLNMMRLQREAQRSADEVRLSWAADAVVERTIGLIGDYVSNLGSFPNRLSADGRLLGGANEPKANALVGGSFKDFDKFLMEDWFRGTPMKNNPNYKSALSDIDVSKIDIFETGRDSLGPDQDRSYLIEVTAHKMVNNASTPLQVTISQAIFRDKSKLFDFSVFCDGDCEVTAGPDFTLQGPIFSNENIYLMNDARQDGVINTLSLKLADTFGSPFNPEPYLMHAHGSTYFYFKRLIGPNYLLKQSSIYNNSVPTSYKFKGMDTPEVNPGYNLTSIYPGLTPPPSSQNIFPPYFYYPTNGANCLRDANGDSCRLNAIQLETTAGTISIAPPLPRMYGFGATGDLTVKDFRFYTPRSEYTLNPNIKMSVSSAFDPSQLPLTSDDLSSVNPKWQDFMNSICGAGSQCLVMDGVSQKKFALGDPKALNGAHLIIEPLTGTPASPLFVSPGGVWDTPTVANQKMQSKADVQLVFGSVGGNFTDCFNQCKQELDQCRIDFPTSTSCIDQNISCYNACYSGFGKWQPNAQFQQFIDKGILRKIDFADFRVIGNSAFPPGLTFELNIALMLDKLGDLGLASKADDGLIVYFAHRPGTILKLINGQRLPEKGFTIISNGRIWVEGNYNIYSYKKGPGNSCANSNGNQSNCYCTTDEWNAGTCKIPPAAVFSDSFGVLSNEWKNHSSRTATLDNRKAASDVMINTALATGYLSSNLQANQSYYAYCTDAQFRDNDLDCSVEHIVPSKNDGSLAGFPCPDKSYRFGKSGVSKSCTYYRESDTVYHYYVNAKSDFYKQVIINPMGTSGVPLCGLVIGDANHDDEVNQADYVIWKKSSGQTGRGLPADFDRNGIVEQRDYDIWRSHFGNTTVPDDCGNVRLPIVADPNTVGDYEPKAVPPLPGVYFTVLDYNALLLSGITCLQSQPAPVCPRGEQPHSETVCTPTYGDDTDPNAGCSSNLVCNDGSPPGPGSACVRSGNASKQSVVSYPKEYYGKLYNAVYGGGLENLINLQEDWRGRTLQFLGTLSVPWSAEDLHANFATWHYRAPKRRFDYNEDLRLHPPPGTPDLSSVTRKRWSRKF